ncbi:uncharacterized protein LOC119185496 [Rhipicephalus microplus]|uniref:uncharacterized protein LOC119185496 n=1 Tax=Rhipicephalus microplus TaxID=6941 RepID=UPI003F6B2E6A
MKAQLLVLVAVFAVAPMAFRAQDLGREDQADELVNSTTFQDQDLGEDYLEDQFVQARFVNGQ